MTFLAAGWLSLLIPWLVVAAWVWRREQRQIEVTSAFLWPDASASSSRERNRHAPPMWILATLFALLLGILALANPVMRATRIRIGLVVDPHVSIRLNQSGKSIEDQLLERFESDLKATGVAVSVERILIDNLPQDRITAVPTASRIENLCIEREREGLPTVVISAQRMMLPDKIVRYAPIALADNVSIVQIGASVEPDPQLMLMMNHPSGQAAFDVSVRTATTKFIQRVEPDVSQTQTTAFIKLPTTSSEAWLEATIESEDALPTDKRAFLVRVGGWPRIEIDGAVPAAVERFAAVYARQRPASNDSKVIRITSNRTDGAALRFDEPTLDVTPQDVQIPELSADSSKTFTAPVSKVVRSTPEGFKAIGWVGEREIVAVKQNSPAQVWIGFDVEAFAQSPQWVAWMDGILSWLNNGGEPRWESGWVNEIEPGWKSIRGDQAVDSAPGVYELPDGSRRAANLRPVEWSVSADESRAVLRDCIARASRAGSYSLGGVLAGAGFFLASFAGILMAGRWRLDVSRGAT